MIIRSILIGLFATLCATAQGITTTPRPLAGVINGDTVWLDEYSREIGRRTEYAQMRGEVNPPEIMQSAWNDIVQRRLLLRASSEHGVTVRLEDVDSVLLVTTPDYIRRGVVDEKGRFDKELLRAMVLRPDSIVRANTRGMSAADQDQEIKQLKATIAQWREFIGFAETESRLRNKITRDVALDTSGLRERFRLTASSVSGDVILVPCAKDLPRPNVTELEAYHKANSALYKTAKPLRRLAVLSWPMTAAPIDSTLVLANIGRFVSMLNGARSAKVRDSIWTSVASTTSTGAIRLSADSASHVDFYRRVKTAKVGTAVGPIMHASGVHIMLVDSVIKQKNSKSPIVRVRFVVTPIDPSKQTVDSLLNVVNEAVSLYESGVELGGVAGRFGRSITLSPWFTADDKVYGSYRLSHVAFNTQVAAACDPIDTPERGVVMAVVVDSVPSGPLPFEAAIPGMSEAIIRQRGCDARRDLAKRVRGLASRLDDGVLFLADKPSEAQVARGLTITGDGYFGDAMYDLTAAREVLSKRIPDLYGPFLGDNGWYTVNITGINAANPDEFPMWLEMRKADIEEEQRTAAWDSFIASLRSNATIDDQRWLYFRY
ncbi:MAG: hypothetical protein FGM33_06705 [Candidatus Kapabacteria bacterium]|nr:hypothetical protein [Candidatus Kapabacteria bacterium]